MTENFDSRERIRLVEISLKTCLVGLLRYGTNTKCLFVLLGLILVEEPYYNEAGYEKHRGTAEGLENSRLYNEMAIIKMMQSIQRMIIRPPELFKEDIIIHFKHHLPK